MELVADATAFLIQRLGLTQRRKDAKTQRLSPAKPQPNRRTEEEKNAFTEGNEANKAKKENFSQQEEQKRF
jgi:hypothetical protein